MAYILPQNGDGIEVYTGNVAILNSDTEGSYKVVVPDAKQWTDIISVTSGYVHHGSIYGRGD